MIFLGIDPGLSGAIAFFDDVTADLDILDMPTLAIGKRKIDLYQLAQRIDAYPMQPTLCAIEQVAARPGAGVSGMFNFGRSYGVVEGVIAAHFWRIEYAMPHVWKRAMACPKEKDGARARASQLLPHHAAKWARVKDDGRAEAALLALYARQLHRKQEMAQ